MINVLIGKSVAIREKIVVRSFFPVGTKERTIGRTLTFGNVGHNMIAFESQMAVAPTTIKPQHDRSCTLLETCTIDIAVILVLVVVRIFITETSVPDKAFLIASKVE